jgi:hypothetical protein
MEVWTVRNQGPDGPRPGARASVHAWQVGRFKPSGRTVRMYAGATEFADSAWIDVEPKRGENFREKNLIYYLLLGQKVKKLDVYWLIDRLLVFQSTVVLHIYIGGGLDLLQIDSRVNPADLTNKSCKKLRILIDSACGRTWKGNVPLGHF